MIKNKI